MCLFRAVRLCLSPCCGMMRIQWIRIHAIRLRVRWWYHSAQRRHVRAVIGRGRVSFHGHVAVVRGGSTVAMRDVYYIETPAVTINSSRRRTAAETCASQRERTFLCRAHMHPRPNRPNGQPGHRRRQRVGPRLMRGAGRAARRGAAEAASPHGHGARQLRVVVGRFVAVGSPNRMLRPPFAWERPHAPVS